MDKLTTISATLFMAADVFAIVSLAMPDWIVSDVGGMYHFNIYDLAIFARIKFNNISIYTYSISFNYKNNI